MASIAVTINEPLVPTPVGPPLHAVLLIALFLGLAVGGAFFQRHAHSQPQMLQQHPEVVPLYISLIALAWGLVIYVWRGGLRKSGTKLSELIGGKWVKATEVLTDVGFGNGVWEVWVVVQTAGVRWLGPEHAAS